MPAQTAASNEAAAHIEGLIQLASSLNEIFEQENEALATGGEADLEHFQAEKQRLAAAFARSIQAVAADRAGACAASPAVLAELREITQRFEIAASCQQALLDGDAY